MQPIEHNLTIASPLATVRNALTINDGLRGWWATTSQRDGDHIVMDFDKDGRTVRMEFDVAEEGPTEVRWTCPKNANPAWVGTQLSWTLRAVGDGTQVVFRHEGFTMGGPPYEMTAGGWNHFVQSLSDYCESGTGKPW